MEGLGRLFSPKGVLECSGGAGFIIAFGFGSQVG